MTVNANGTPGVVAPGELIESTWGNAVSDSVPQISYSLGTRAARKMLAQGGYTIVTTDANGDGRIDFQSAFLFVPAGIQVQLANPALFVLISVNVTAATYFTFRVRNITDGGATTNYAVKVSWLAIGER